CWRGLHATGYPILAAPPTNQARRRSGRRFFGLRYSDAANMLAGLDIADWAAIVKIFHLWIDAYANAVWRRRVGDLVIPRSFCMAHFSLLTISSTVPYTCL